MSLSTGELGAIEGNFGQSGKAKIRIFNDGLKNETIEVLQSKADSKKKGKKLASSQENAIAPTEMAPIGVILRFKRYVYDPKKLMIQ